jgi:large conductance mechanosensitive channel
MGMLKEFKDFAVRGNVVDMAVGIIIGAAFGKIVTSLVNDLVMPPIGMLLGNVDFSDLSLVLREQTAQLPAVTVNYGAFINNVLDFLIVAFVIFLLIKQVNRLKRDEAKQPETTKNCPFCRMVIDIQATRCPNCTSELESAAARS